MINYSKKDENYDKQNKSMSLNEKANKNKLEPGEENVKDLNKANNINMNDGVVEENKINNKDENDDYENNENKVDNNEEKYNNNDNNKY